MTQTVDMNREDAREEHIYVMYNPSNGAKIECTIDYLAKWMSMGFEVLEIRKDVYRNHE